MTERRCSAKGCTAGARHALVWRNPKLHASDREKRWAACDEHLERLSVFLGARDFLLRVDPATPDTDWDS